MPLHECLARLSVFPWHRFPGAWKLPAEGEWLGPLGSSVSCRAQHVVPSPLRAEAGRGGSFCRPGPPVGIATAASAVTPPLSHVTCSLLHSGDKWPSAQPLSSQHLQVSGASPGRGCPPAAQSSSKKTGS